MPKLIRKTPKTGARVVAPKQTPLSTRLARSVAVKKRRRRAG